MLQVVLAAASAATIVSSTPEWTVKKSVDQMTDKVTCTAFFRNNPKLQLNRRAFYIALGTVPKGITLRFGDAAARRMRLASDIEKSIGVIDIMGSDFSELLSSGRVRYSVISWDNRLIEDDVRLAEIDLAFGILNSRQCE